MKVVKACCARLEAAIESRAIVWHGNDWAVPGCCGGCSVLSELRYCPYCGAELRPSFLTPHPHHRLLDGLYEYGDAVAENPAYCAFAIRKWMADNPGASPSQALECTEEQLAMIRLCQHPQSPSEIQAIASKWGANPDELIKMILIKENERQFVQESKSSRRDDLPK